MENITQNNESTVSRYLNHAIDFSVSSQNHKRGLALITDYIACMFNVGLDEVAILLLDRQGKNLHFIAPDYLATLRATIPFDRVHSQAGLSLWDRKPKIQNQLSAVNHLAYFENAKRGNPRPSRIEKMLSYPIYIGNSPLGVVQISRKLTISPEDRPNFTAEDVSQLETVRSPFSRLLQGIRSVWGQTSDN